MIALFWRMFAMMLEPAIKNLLAAFTSALCGFGAFGVQAADAQTSLSPQIVPQNPPSYCKTETPQAANFIVEISTIVAHGDLADIPFAEKTFRTKFKEEPAKTFEGEPDPKRILFQTNQIFGSPIHVDVSLNRSKTSPPKHQSIGYMVIYDQHSAGLKTTFIEDCIDISARAFSSHFGGDFVHIPSNDDPSPYTTQYRQQDFPGKDNTMLQLGISSDYMRPGNPVVAVEISQVSQHADSGS
jgi:hypothetical protein